MASKRERSTNWEKEEKHLLKQIVKPNLNVIENKDLTTNTNTAKLKVWAEITEKFNVLNPKHRDKKQIVNQWKTMKLNAKKEVSKYRREITKTGGGPRPPSPSLDVMELVDLLPAEFEVDYNEFDCDGVKENQDTMLTMELEKKVDETPMHIPVSEEMDLENNENIDKNIEAAYDSPCVPLLNTPKKVQKKPIPRKKDFNFAEKSYADMHHFRVLESERQQKEHELRMKHMTEIHNQVLTNLKLQQEILGKSLASK